MVLGGTSGIISSDPAYSYSGMYLLSQDGTVIGLDTDGNSVSSFEVRRGTSTTVFKVDEEGNVSYGGTGLTAFPKPAYDSSGRQSALDIPPSTTVWVVTPITMWWTFR